MEQSLKSGDTQACLHECLIQPTQAGRKATSVSSYLQAMTRGVGSMEMAQLAN
jgi:hypothetical protein